MSRRLLVEIDPQTWDSPKSSGQRTLWLQQLDDLMSRSVNNRQQAMTSTATTGSNGALQSTGVGVGPMTPKRYAEFTVKARVTYQASGPGPVYIYVHRTTSAIPPNGQAPNANDVIVGGDAFAGGQLAAGINQAAAFSFLDSGLSTAGKYHYYFSVKAPGGVLVSLLNSSQLLVMERS
jgi:hypothetical protein